MMNFMKKKERFFDLCYGFLWMAVCRNSYLMQHHYNYIILQYPILLVPDTIYYIVRNAKQYIMKIFFEIFKKLMKGMWEYVGILQNKLINVK